MVGLMDRMSSRKKPPDGTRSTALDVRSTGTGTVGRARVGVRGRPSMSGAADAAGVEARSDP